MSQQFKTDKPTIEEIRRLKKPNERSVDIVLDPSIGQTISELERKYTIEKRKDERENRSPEAPAILKTIEELRIKGAEQAITFTFRDIGRKRFDALVDDHPPTDDQKKQNQEWNSDTFTPALLAASAVQPEINLDAAQSIFDEWSHGDLTALFLTALAACTERASIPFTSSDTDAILDSASSLITRLSEESPTEDS